jgi:hypothetical protein
MSRRSSAKVLGGASLQRRAAAFFRLGLKPRMPSRLTLLEPAPEADVHHAFSKRQHNLTALDFIVAETSRDLAMWANDGGITGDCNH